MPSVKSVSPVSVLARFLASYGPGKFTADLVAPAKMVDDDTVVVPKSKRSDILGDKEDYRVAPGGEPNRLRSDFETVSLAAESYAAIVELPQEVLDANQLAIDLVSRELTQARNKLMAVRERELAAVLDNAANYDATTAVTNPWSDTTNGTPRDDLYSALEALPEALPGTKTLLHITPEAWHALAKHPQFRGGGSARSVVSKEEILSLFEGELDDIVIAPARVRTSRRGATASFSRIFDKTKARIVRIPASTNAQEMSAHTLSFRRNLGPGGWYVERWRDPEPGRSGSVKVKVSMAEVIKTIQSDQGHLLTSVL